MTDNIRSTPSSAGVTDTPLRWSVHLASAHRLKLICALAAVALVAVLAYEVIGPAGPIAVLFAMAGALAEFLFPMRFEIGLESAICRTVFKKAEIPWSRVKTCYLDDCGVKLSPLEPGSRLEAYRGVYLRFADNREQVIEAVKAMRAAQC